MNPFIFEHNIEDRTQRYYGKFYNKLQQQKVLVIGAGAVGTEVIKNLAMLGIRHIYLVDFDKVSISNLNRCVFFRPEDNGNTYKVDAIAREVKARWKQIEIIPYQLPIQEAPDQIWDVPVVILAVDNNQARYYTNMRILSSNNATFVINGAMGKSFIEIQVLLPGKTSCLLCPWTKDYSANFFTKIVKETCDQFFSKTVEQFPSISILNSIIGGLIAHETVKILIGYQKWEKEKQWEEEYIPILGQVIRYDITTHEFTIGKTMPNPKCIEIFCRQSQNINDQLEIRWNSD